MAVFSAATYIFILFYCACLTIATTTLTPKPYTTNIPHKPVNVNSTGVIDSRSSKLLDIRMGGKSEPFKAYLQNLIRKEDNTVLNESHRSHRENNAIASPDKIQTPTERSYPVRPGQDTLLILLDTLSKEIQEIRGSLKTLNGDIVSLRENHSSIGSAGKCKFDSVGVNYNPGNVIKTSNKSIPKNCLEVQENGYNVSGIYEIRPRHAEQSFMVLCDMETRGGGWTHIQKRFDGSQDFFLDWRNYKFGFGDLEREFWLGLEDIYLLTAFEVNELLVEIVDRDDKKATASYSAFGIASETDGYNLNVLRGYSGDAGDSLTHHFGANFSTKDFDQDSNNQNCAELYKGGWWYQSCHISNLNGKYINVDLPEAYKYQGLHWKTYRSHEYCHSKSRMLIRPAQK